jgi:hypothetical protein
VRVLRLERKIGRLRSRHRVSANLGVSMTCGCLPSAEQQQSEIAAKKQSRNNVEKKLHCSSPTRPARYAYPYPSAIKKAPAGRPGQGQWWLRGQPQELRRLRRARTAAARFVKEEIRWANSTGEPQRLERRQITGRERPA